MSREPGGGLKQMHEQTQPPYMQLAHKVWQQNPCLQAAKRSQMKEAWHLRALRSPWRLVEGVPHKAKSPAAVQTRAQVTASAYLSHEYSLVSHMVLKADDLQHLEASCILHVAAAYPNGSVRASCD